MKRKLLFLFGSMAAMMLSASPVVDRVDFSKKLPAGSAMSAKVDNLEKLNLSSKKLIRGGKVNKSPEQLSSNPWYADSVPATPTGEPYYISFGHFNCGMSSQTWLLDDNYMLQPAYAPVIYYSLANYFGYNQIGWTFWDPTIDSVAYSTEQYLIHEYPETGLVAPFLTASVDGEYESTYPSLDADAPTTYAIYGGNLIFDIGEPELMEFGACNYDNSKGIALSGLGAGSDADWEAAGISVKGIMNLFEEPSAPYLLDGLWLTAYNIVASPDAELTMTIYKAYPEENVYNDMVGDVIATSTVGVDNIEYVDGSAFASVHFPIMTVDEDGFETEGGIFISDAIFVEITGYNTPEFTSFEPIMQGDPHTSGNNYFFIKAKDLKTNELNVVTFTNISSSWMVNLSASFPFLATQEDEYTADEEGGEFIVSVAIPSYSMSKSPARVISSTETTSGIVIKEMPEWVSYVSDSYNETTGMYDFVMNAEAMPDEMEGRQDEIVFGYNSMEMIVPVNQGTPMSVEDAYAKAITSAFILDDLQLTYPSDVKKLSIYSATGTLVKIVDLDEGGSDVVSMPMAKGVYMLSFEGKDRVVRKVIK